MSISTVLRLQGGTSTSSDPRGGHLFDRRGVEELRTRRPPPPEPRDCRDPGELAAESFKLLRDGDVRDLVVALRRPAAEMAAIYAEWGTHGGSLVISESVRSRLAKLVRQGLLPAEAFEAIEEDDRDITTCDLVNDAVQAHRLRASR